MHTSPCAELEQLMSASAAAPKLSALLVKIQIAKRCCLISDGQHISVVPRSEIASLCICPEAATDNRCKMLRQEQLCIGCMHRYTYLISAP